MKYAEKIERKITKLVSENNSAKANYQARIEKAKAEKAEGQRELNAAAEADDDAAYHRAKDKIRYADDTIEMCSNRLDKLDEALCSEKEYKEIINEINAESEKAEKDAEKKAAALLKELYKLSIELGKAIDENNRLLEKWCVLIHKDSEPPRYYSKSDSEVLYLGNMIIRRKAAKKGLQNAGIDTDNIYDSIAE